MMQAYKTVLRESECEYVVQRSRFIGRCFPVQSEGEALALLEGIRKKHYDASHNCFAYRIGPLGAAGRFSDDGEPGGTAGKPIMDVLMGRELVDALVVVTRYFGGILLGAGGLVRSYSHSAAQAVTAAGMVEMRPGTEFALRVEYPLYSTVEALVKRQAEILSCDFGAAVEMRAVADAREAAALFTAITDKSGGRCTPQSLGERYMRVPLEG